MSMMFTISPKMIYEEISECAAASLVPLFTSAPGVGKSAAVWKFAKDFRLKMIDVRLSQCMPEDLNGFPMRVGNKATFTPFDMFPIEGDEIPEGYDGWCVFLDEATSATKPVQAAAYKLIYDKMIGSHKLHERVIIVAAGNRVGDKAVVNQMSTALQSRMIHYDVEVNLPDFLEHAIEADFDRRVTGFVSYLPLKLMDFKPDHNDKTFTCPRTLEFLSRLIKGKEITPQMAPRIAGTIGQGNAVEFMTFAEEYDRLPKFADIIADPIGTPVPPESSTKYATMSMLIGNSDEENLEHVLKYITKFSMEIQIIFSRGMATRFPRLTKEHEAFSAFLLKMTTYLT